MSAAAAYIVVHTIGGRYGDADRFPTDHDAQFDFSYTDALDLAAEIRAHDGHWARIDAEYPDGSRYIR